VTDTDRSEVFYAGLGWRLDADVAFDNGFRVVQFTPPGSGASIQFGSKATAAVPGSAAGLYLIVSDIQAARDALADVGVEVSEVFRPGAWARRSHGMPSITSAVLRPITRPTLLRNVQRPRRQPQAAFSFGNGFAAAHGRDERRRLRL
jgi:hypothetical protein